MRRRTRASNIGWLRWFCPSTSTHAKVGCRPQICHPDRSVAQWRDLRLALMEKFEGGSPPLHGWRWMDRLAQRRSHTHAACPLALSIIHRPKSFGQDWVVVFFSFWSHIAWLTIRTNSYACRNKSQLLIEAARPARSGKHKHSLPPVATEARCAARLPADHR